MNKSELIKTINRELNKLPENKLGEYCLFMKSTDTKEGMILNSLKIKIRKYKEGIIDEVCNIH